jgi:hypothetical protein
MANDIWLGVLRHLLTVFGGFFVARGYVDADALHTAVGAATTLAGVGWSVWDKRAR